MRNFLLGKSVWRHVRFISGVLQFILSLWEGEATQLGSC